MASQHNCTAASIASILALGSEDGTPLGVVPCTSQKQMAWRMNGLRQIAMAHSFTSSSPTHHLLITLSRIGCFFFGSLCTAARQHGSTAARQHKPPNCVPVLRVPPVPLHESASAAKEGAFVEVLARPHCQRLHFGGTNTPRLPSTVCPHRVELAGPTPVGRVPKFHSPNLTFQRHYFKLSDRQIVKFTLAI